MAGEATVSNAAGPQSAALALGAEIPSHAEHQRGQTQPRRGSGRRG